MFQSLIGPIFGFLHSSVQLIVMYRKTVMALLQEESALLETHSNKTKAYLYVAVVI